MMMMKNNRPSASKLGSNGRRERKLKQKSSPRSPLKVKDLNVSSSCSSSSTSTTTSSISSEDPRNCLRFFLSHHPSSTTTVSKKACNKPKSVVAKTPKSAPNVNNSRGKSSDGNVMKKCNNLRNPEKPTSKRVHILRKNPPLSSRSDLSDKLSSGSELKLFDNAANSTPVTKLGSGCFDSSITSHDKAFKSGDNDPNCSDYTSPVPPVQVSVSPEIQGGSTSIVPATPTTCYGAGHVLSGVSDKRKCKPRGILTIGNNDLFGSGKTKMFDNGDENVTMIINNHRASLVLSPTEASVHWLLSPCDEKRGEEQEDDDGSGLRLDRREHSSPSKSISCLSSPSSSLGFSSQVLSKSNGTITTSDATTTTHSSRKNKSSFMHSDSSSESRGLLGPSLDYMVCSPSPSSPVSMPSYKFDVSPTQVKCQYDHEGEATTYMEDSMGSGNVIRTPQSDSSSLNLDLSRDEISRLWFECELDSVAEVLGRVSLSPECQIPTMNSSFEFNPLIKPASSIDFTLFRKAVGTPIPAEVPGSLLHNLPESEVGISWREVLASHIFEMDDLDYCRCFSDEEDNTNGSFSCQELGAVDPCKESTSDDDGGSLPAPKDSG